MADSDAIPFVGKSTLEPQRVLDLFIATYGHVLTSDELTEYIQLVKADLYHRDYLSAFSTEDKRLAYAARWTPARALLYLSLFSSLEPLHQRLAGEGALERATTCLCIGGGAGAEVVALALLFCRTKEYLSTSASCLSVVAVDIADWGLNVRALTKHIKSHWVYDETKFNADFVHADILTAQLPYRDFDLITLMFTTNELFAEKRPQTVELLQRLSAQCKRGCALLITESAGLYSHIAVGARKFPVQFLIDTVLLGRPGTNAGAWRVAQQSDSCWYRVNAREVSYPMKLESMRFFYRLYVKK
jgi:25S rRNA (uracil2843-N3)-methyltransferase